MPNSMCRDEWSEQNFYSGTRHMDTFITRHAGLISNIKIYLPLDYAPKTSAKEPGIAVNANRNVAYSPCAVRAS